MFVSGFLVFTAGCKFARPLVRILHERPSRLGAWLALALWIGMAWPTYAYAPERMHPGETQTGLASWYGNERGATQPAASASMPTV